MSHTTCLVQHSTSFFWFFLQSLEEGISKQSHFYLKIVFIVSLYSWCFFLYIAFIHSEENNQEI